MPLMVPDKVNMNYANMIEEKNLKKTFIIATLVSTLVGTFAASHNLYERLSQKKKDGAQDDAIKKLEVKFDELSKKKESGEQKKDELKESLDSSGPIIKKEYDIGYDRLGRRFAVGDILTENELQKQIILLQQTVIGILEDAVYNGRQIDTVGLEQLMRASKAARNGSLNALKGQYQRIAQQLPPPRSPRDAVEAEVIELSSRGSSPRRPPLRALPMPAKATSPARPPPPLKKRSAMDFFCPYSVDLQRSPMPLAGAFDPGRGSRCPVCKLKIPVDAADMWDIEFPVKKKLSPAPAMRSLRAQSPPAKSTASKKTMNKSKDKDKDKDKEKDQERGNDKNRDNKDRSRSRADKEVVAVAEKKQEMLKFRVPPKFVIKCHTPEGDYACVICCGPRGDYSGVVLLCDDPESLVDHVAKEHKVVEIEREVDILPG